MALVTCSQCYAVFEHPVPPGVRHFDADCPQCRQRVIVSWQPPVGPTERKRADAGFEMLTPAGRFLGIYDPARQVVTLPYRGEDYEFDLTQPETWAHR